MTAPKPPKRPIKPPTPATPEETLANAPLDVLMDALAKVSGELQGKDGAELRQHISQVKTQVQTLVEQVDRQEENQAAKQVVAGEVEKLIEAVAKTGTAAGRAVARSKAPITQAFRGVDLDKMADGLRLLADWLQNPSDEKAAQVQQLVGTLQTTMGSLVNHDPARDEEERRAEIKRGVQASLDEIFRGKKPG
ncbi:MAG: hypothetical protein M3680_19515 [Myxococcota bacterium]|nr:hypothetical protein [Myxococcota bacterium]